MVGTLVTEASTSLKPDYTQITAALLTELISVQRAIASNISVSSIPSSSLHLESPPTSTASSTDFWVNALWFTSLAISLAIALVSVLVRQWLHAYVTPTSGTPKDQSHIRHFRYMGIEQWQVPLIAGLLPIMLHLSLFLFFIGLVVFLRDLDRTIAAVVTGIFLVVFFVYTVANLWPVFNIQCPYKTPLSDSIMSTSRRILSALRETRHARKPSPLEPSNIPSSSERTSAHTSSQKLRGGQCWTMKEVESQAVRARIDTLSVQMLSWLSSASSNPSIRGVAIHAVPDLPIEFTGSKILRDALLPDVCSRMEIIHRSWANGTYKLTPDIEERLYLIAHAHLALDPNAHPRLANRDGTKFFQGDRCHWGFYEMVGRRIMANSSIGHERLQSLRHVYLSPNHRSRDPWALRVPSPQDLVKLQPRATSDRVWIALLQSAIIGVREGPASNQSNFPGWPALSPLLQLASQPMECNFDIIQSTLIYAYLCHLTRPGTTKVEDHPLLDVVLFYSEIYGNLASRLEEFQQAVNHYRARLCIHVLSHAVPAQPSSALTLESVIADILVEQFEMESIMVSKLAWTPFRPEPAIEERLLWFVPNPVFPDGSVTRYLKTAHSLSTLSMILLHLDSPRILDAFRQNRILESMHSMHGILLCPPGRPMMLEDEVTKYVQAVLECPRLEQQQRHVEYIFDHLKEICAWLIFSRRLRVDGFRQCVLPLLSRYPGHSQWDVVVDTLMDSWMLAGEDREVVEELIRQVVSRLSYRFTRDLCVLNSVRRPEQGGSCWRTLTDRNDHPHAFFSGWASAGVEMSSESSKSRKRDVVCRASGEQRPAASFTSDH